MFSSRQNVGLLVAGFFVGLLVRSLVSWSNRWSLGQFFLERTLCHCAVHHQTSPTLASFIGIIFLSEPAKSDHCLLLSFRQSVLLLILFILDLSKLLHEFF